MTPQEKAKELVDKFKELYDYGSLSKECALIAVDEILSAICFNMYDEDAYNKEVDYWEEVKREINKL